MPQDNDCYKKALQSLIAFGSNLSSASGSPEETLQAAFSMLQSMGIESLSVSRLFRTPCFPAGAGPDFVNAAATVTSTLSPNELLTLLHLVESRLGRVRDARWGARTLDIDLIAMGDKVLPDRETFQQWFDLPPIRQAEIAPGQLILPHPRMHQRAFVLIPLADVAPDWRHPVLGLTVAEMVLRLPESDCDVVKPL